MKVYTFEGKNLEEITTKALNELDKTEEDVLIKETEVEGGLFKSKKTKLEIIVKPELLQDLKELLLSIIEKMGIEANIEAKIRENRFLFTLYSNNNAILIGKNGRTIESLQTILKYAVSNRTHFNVGITVDVENYKEKQLHRIEMLAAKTAQEVLATGVEVKLDSMNSYERRLVHEEASKVNGVHTQSEGVEPNRYVVIKPDEK